MTASPPKEHNFDSIPTVHSIDEFFHRKYEEDEETGEFTKIATAEEILADQEAHADAHMHMPSPSYWPMVLALGLPVVAIGLIFNIVISVAGALIIIARRLRLGRRSPRSPTTDDYDPPSDASEGAGHR